MEKDSRRTPDHLLSDASLGLPSHRALKEIAIVTSDISGPVQNGGVGTAYSSLAELLADAGHRVTILFVCPSHPKDREFHEWQAHYLRKEIRLLSLPEPPIPLEGRTPAKLSYAAYLFLKDRSFDIIHFPDMHGLGYYSLLAKKQGIAFARTRLCVILNGPTSWHLEGNQRLNSESDGIQYDFLERKSVELAETLISPSRYAWQWAQSAGWKLPRRVFVEQYPLIEQELRAPARKKKGRRKIRELVFFGRLETRKGLGLFCDALDRLSRSDLQVTFLGQSGWIGQQRAVEYLQQRSARWRHPIQILPNYGRLEAHEYLRSGSILAVLPSLHETLGYTAMECLSLGIPFIANRIPAFEELIDRGDHARVFFDGSADSLAARLEQVLVRGAAPASFAVSPELTNRRWVRWHDRIRPTPAERRPAGKKRLPLVSVCVSHRNRPALLEQCLESLKRQTYPDFEVIVADDASDQTSALALLAALEPQLKRRGWTILRAATRMGPAGLRNLAARAARGEYLLFMDDDNLAKPEEIETFVRSALKTGADVLTCPFDRFRGASGPEASTEPPTRWLAVGDDLASGFFVNCFGDMNALVRKETFLALGGLRELADAACEDWEFFARAVIAGYSLTVVPEALFWHRDHGGSFSRRADPFRSLKLRLSAYQGLLDRPDFSALMLALASQRDRLFPDADRRGASRLFNPDRSNLFDRRGRYTRTIYRAESRAEFSRFQPVSDIRLKPRKDAMLLESQGSSAVFRLPEFSFRRRQRALVEIELTSFEKSTMRIFYGSGGKRGQILVGRRPYDVGNSRIHILLNSPGLSGPIRISPASGPGTLLIRRVEVFAEP